MVTRQRYVGRQLSLGLGEEVDVNVFGIDEGDQHGEVFTRRWVVELIRDLVGYTPDRDLEAMVAVEPACGAGAFLDPMVERLIDSCRRHRRISRRPLVHCARSICCPPMLNWPARLWPRRSPTRAYSRLVLRCLPRRPSDALTSS